MAVTSIRPKDKIIVDQTGRIKLEWDAFLSRLESRLNEVEAAVAAPDDTGPVTAVVSGSVTAAATLDLTLGTADMYEIDLINFVPVNDAISFQMRFSQSGTFLAGASDYQWGVSAGASALDAADNQIVLCQLADNSAGSYNMAKIRIYRPSASSFRKTASWESLRTNGATSIDPILGQGALLANTNAIDGVRIMYGSGNIASGYYAMRSYRFA